MMTRIDLVLYIAGFILFVLGAVGYPPSRYNLVAAGLACWILTLIV